MVHEHAAGEEGGVLRPEDLFDPEVFEQTPDYADWLTRSAEDELDGLLEL